MLILIYSVPLNFVDTENTDSQSFIPNKCIHYNTTHDKHETPTRFGTAALSSENRTEQSVTSPTNLIQRVA